MAMQVEMALEGGGKGKQSQRGGRRDGAGRPPKKDRRDPLHAARPKVSKHEPQHVVLRTLPTVPRLRKGKVFHALRHTLRRMLGDLGFRVVHLSIQHNHLHLLVEAHSKVALRRGMQAFAISAAKQINRVCRRKGKVFAFRYHATAIRSPRQARHALAYILRGSSRIRFEREEHARWSFRCAASHTALLRSTMSPRVMQAFAWICAPDSSRTTQSAR